MSQIATDELSAYRPFSNGSEFEHWNSLNCHACRWGAEGDATPHCAGEHGLLLGLFGDGSVPVMALDFIGTTERTNQNGKGFCSLKRDCQQFEYPDDQDDEGETETLKDVELREAVAEAFDRHGYKLTDFLRKATAMSRFPY